MTNIKVASVSGMTAGDTIEFGGAFEVRTIVTVGTAGSGGTGIVLDDALGYAHASAESVTVRYWGGWSNTEIVTYHPAPTAAASTPLDAATVNAPTQALAWTLSTTQSAARISIYQRISGIDYLKWQEVQNGTGTSWSFPLGLLVNGVAYAWEVTAYDGYGLSDTTTRRTFTTSFAPPAELAGLAGVADASESSVALAWTASGDTYFDHYRVYWQTAAGEWQRVDGGPDGPGDSGTKLTAEAFTHYGARFGDNEYAVTASNGALESDPAYVTVTLDSPVPGFWMLVIPDETQYTTPLRVVSVHRRHDAIMERYDPPGRGDSVHLSWGRGPLGVDLTVQARPSVDGDVVAPFERITAGDREVWIKAPPGWQWEPVHARLASFSEQPITGGMLVVMASFERTDED